MSQPPQEQSAAIAWHTITEALRCGHPAEARHTFDALLAHEREQVTIIRAALKDHLCNNEQLATERDAERALCGEVVEELERARILLMAKDATVARLEFEVADIALARRSAEQRLAEAERKLAAHEARGGK
jgi:hypothetical protein